MEIKIIHHFYKLSHIFQMSLLSRIDRDTLIVQVRSKVNKKMDIRKKTHIHLPIEMTVKIDQSMKFSTSKCTFARFKFRFFFSFTFTCLCHLLKWLKCSSKDENYSSGIQFHEMTTFVSHGKIVYWTNSKSDKRIDLVG